jgi:hypothetical protein
VKLLDNRARRCSVLDWRAGRRSAPRWALELLAGKIRAQLTEAAAIADQALQTPERPGLKSGALNLAKWRARR